MNARQLALLALQKIERHNAYADVVLEQLLARSHLSPADCHLVSELVYGVTRRRRTLDALIDCFARHPASKQPPTCGSFSTLAFTNWPFWITSRPGPPSTPVWNWPAKWVWDR